MKKIILSILIPVCILCLASCKKNVETTSETLAESTSESTTAVITTVLPSETTDPTTQETTTNAKTTAAVTVPVSAQKVTEAVTYSAAGIPVANAFFSLYLPASWDGYYLSDTSFDEQNVMSVHFREFSSAESGYGGRLFSIVMVPSDVQYTSPNAYVLGYLHSPAASYTLFADYPSDVQYTEEAKSQYTSMKSEIGYILASVKAAAGFTLDK